MTIAFFIVGMFWVWLIAAIIFGNTAKNPAAHRYKWLIGWPLGVVLLVAALLGWIISLPKYFIRKADQE